MINDVYIGIGSNIVPEGYRDIHTALLDATTQISNSVDVVANDGVLTGTWGAVKKKF